jgi:hypothetical protein
MTNKKIILLISGLLLLYPCLSFANTMYMDTRSDSPIVSSLYTVDNSSGTAGKVGDIKASTGGDLTINDIAYNPVNQTMYAISANQLWTLNYTSGNGIITATAAGGKGITNRRGLEVIDSTIYLGTAKTTTASGALFTLDPATGAATEVGDGFGDFGAAGTYVGLTGDLAYANGKLYATMTWSGRGHGGTYLATIDLDSGLATEVGKILSGNNSPTIDGIVFENGVLYGATQGNAANPGTLYVLAIPAVPGDVMATKIGDNTGAYAAWGLTTVVPVPPSALLVGSGLLSLGLLGSRRKTG